MTNYEGRMTKADSSSVVRPPSSVAPDAWQRLLDLAARLHRRPRHLGLHNGGRVWKGFDWDALARLHAKGYISDPVGKAKSVVFTEEGLAESERLLQELFG